MVHKLEDVESLRFVPEHDILLAAVNGSKQRGIRGF